MPRGPRKLAWFLSATSAPHRRIPPPPPSPGSRDFRTVDTPGFRRHLRAPARRVFERWTPWRPPPPPSPGSRGFDGEPPRVPVAISGPRPGGFSNGGHPRMPVATSEPRLAGFWTPDCSSLPPWAVGLPSGRFGCVVSEPRWVPAFPAALARFFAVGCVAYIARRAAVGSPGLVPRSGYTRRQLGRESPPVAPRSRAGGHALPRAAEWLHPQAGWLGGRRRLRAGRRISSDECAASGGRHWVPSPPGPSDALASPIQP